VRDGGEAHWQVIDGDAREVLPSFPAESVSACVTSPPYFRCRDERVEGQVGREEHPDEYVDALVTVFDEVRRVLRPDGTLWLNLGDCFAQRRYELRDGSKVKPKDLIGLPWMVAFALRRAGWYLRSEVVWHKLDPVPEVVRDRPGRDHEQVFLLAVRARYAYDAEAVRVDLAKTTSGTWSERYAGAREGTGTFKRDYQRPSDGKRDLRTVWPLPTASFDGAHFATFPLSLADTCIRASVPAGGLVLDPFAGAGTVGLVALRHNRSFIGIEVNPANAVLARDRIRDDAPLLNPQAERDAYLPERGMR
jgi:DNA modification methylase